MQGKLYSIRFVWMSRERDFQSGLLWTLCAHSDEPEFFGIIIKNDPDGTNQDKRFELWLLDDSKYCKHPPIKLYFKTKADVCDYVFSRLARALFCEDFEIINPPWFDKEHIAEPWFWE